MDDTEDDQAARELKALLCDACYSALIGWIIGKSRVPYVPCDACAPTSKQWLEDRWRKRGES